MLLMHRLLMLSFLSLLCLLIFELLHAPWKVGLDNGVRGFLKRMRALTTAGSRLDLHWLEERWIDGWMRTVGNTNSSARYLSFQSPSCSELLINPFIICEHC